MLNEKNLNEEIKNEPLVSVIIPIYNSESYVGGALESIINQTYKNLEIILIDDGSTDKSLDIIGKYAEKDKRVVIIKNESNSGIVVSLNKGISYCHGKYVARMDSDDWSFPYRISKQVEFLEKNPDVVICGGSIEITNESLKPLNHRMYPVDDKSVRKLFFRYSPFAHPCVTYRTDAIKKVGLYNESIPLAQDYDLYFRLGKVGKLANIPDVILKLRVHGESLSMSKARKQELFALHVRVKAWLEYGYDARVSDVVYTFMQFVSVYIMPPKFKFWLFNLIRSKDTFK